MELSELYGLLVDKRNNENEKPRQTSKKQVLD